MKRLGLIFLAVIITHSSIMPMNSDNSPLKIQRVTTGTEGQFYWNIYNNGLIGSCQLNLVDKHIKDEMYYVCKLPDKYQKYEASVTHNIFHEAFNKLNISSISIIVDGSEQDLKTLLKCYFNFEPDNLQKYTSYSFLKDYQWDDDGNPWNDDGKPVDRHCFKILKDEYDNGNYVTSKYKEAPHYPPQKWKGYKYVPAVSLEKFKEIKKKSGAVEFKEFTLVPWCLEYAKQLCQYLNDPFIQKWLWGKKIWTLDDVKEKIKAYQNDESLVRWLVIKDNKVIGDCGILRVDLEKRCAELVLACRKNTLEKGWEQKFYNGCLLLLLMKLSCINFSHKHLSKITW